jgi:hypothetical protein
MSQGTLKLFGYGIAIIIFFMILIMVWNSFGLLQERSQTQSLKAVQTAVEQAVMQCYALEGAYPPDLNYLQDHYGLIINEDRYVYLYEVVGENIHPIIDVQFLEAVQQ